MKRISLFLLMAIIMAGCHSGADNVMYIDDYYDSDTVVESGNDAIGVMEIETIDNRDLILETDDHIIKMMGTPGKQYKYYVWTGDKDTQTQDPDVIVDRGAVMVRKPE